MKGVYTLLNPAQNLYFLKKVTYHIHTKTHKHEICFLGHSMFTVNPILPHYLLLLSPYSTGLLKLCGNCGLVPSCVYTPLSIDRQSCCNKLLQNMAKLHRELSVSSEVNEWPDYAMV